MKAIIVDDYGDITTVEVQDSPNWSEENFVWQDLFEPCGVCGLGVISESFDFEADCCKRCLKKEKDVEGERKEA